MDRRGSGLVALALAACTIYEPDFDAAPEPELCPPQSTTLDVSRSPRSFAKSPTWSFFPGDVNGDGIADLVVTDEIGVHFYFRPAAMTEDPAIDIDALLAGVGGFSITTSEGAWTHHLEPISGDVNGDGRDDVILLRGDVPAITVVFAPASTARRPGSRSPGATSRGSSYSRAAFM